MKELSEPVIDKLQNYFGIALQSNLNTVEQMQKAIWPSFFHVSSSEKKNFQDYCEKSSSSWCQYQINDTNIYKPGRGLSQNVIKPIYLDLINPVELKKCLHGLTQNQNESFNSMIWERAPKTTYCGYEKLEFAVYDACAHFNYGRQATIDILKIMNVDAGYHTRMMCYKLNKRRKYRATYKSKASSNKARKIIRDNKKKKVVKQKQTEGKVYKAGGF